MPTPTISPQLTVAKGADGHLVGSARSREVELDSIERRADFRGNGLPQLGLGIVKTSTANTLVGGQRASRPRSSASRARCRRRWHLRISFDSSVFVESSVNEVYKT